jgi:hypothetical protein
MHTFDSPDLRQMTLGRLARELRKLENSAPLAGTPAERIVTGMSDLDALLPESGFRPGSLIEWLAESGAGDQFVLLASRLALGQEGTLVVVDPDKTFYPPAATGLGIDLRRLVLVRPRHMTDALWAVEQSLRCRGVAVTFCRLEQLNARLGRRLQLAAEHGGGLGFLIRPPSVRKQPSWSDVRFLIEPVCRESSSSGRRWRVEVLRCRRGGAGEQSILLECDDATNAVHLVSEPLPTAQPRRATGA